MDLGIDIDEAVALLKPDRRQELRERAHEVTVRCVERRFDFCSIINARSGRCSEDCKWCAQSGRWRTGCETYGWVPVSMKNDWTTIYGDGVKYIH